MKIYGLKLIFLSSLCFALTVSCGSDDKHSAPGPQEPNFGQNLSNEEMRSYTATLYAFTRNILTVKYSRAARSLSPSDIKHAVKFNYASLKPLNSKQIQTHYKLARKIVAQIAVNGVSNPIKEKYRLYYVPAENTYDAYDVDRLGVETRISDAPDVKVSSICIERMEFDYQCNIVFIKIDDPVHGTEYALFRLAQSEYVHLDYSPEVQAYAVLDSNDLEGQRLLEEYIMMKGVNKLQKKGFFKGLLGLNKALSNGILKGLNALSELLTPKRK